MNRILIASLASTMMAGCATTSFAPPPIEVTYPEAPRGQTACPRKAQALPWTVTVTRDVTGATRMVETYIAAFDCSKSGAANGRQWFEVPAFLAVAASATAVAFGASPDFIIAGGAISSVLGGGKNYYSPREKADVYDAALDALYCIQTEALGVDAIASVRPEVDKPAPLTGAIDKAGGSSGPKPESGVDVAMQAQYFALIASALGQVKRVAGQRLSHTGTYDAAGVAAEIKQAEEEAKAAAPAKPAAGDDQAAGGDGAPAPPDATKSATLERLRTMINAQHRSRDETSRITLKEIKPKLDACVVRAKI